MAMRLSGMRCAESELDLIISLYEGILKKGDRFDLKDIASVKAENCGKYLQEFIEKGNKKSEEQP